MELLLQRPDLWGAKDALNYAESASKTLDLRPLALATEVYRQPDWVRSKKETWRNHENWDRRALIWAARILPTGEKRPFLSMAEEQGEALDSSIAKFPLSQI